MQLCKYYVLLSRQSLLVSGALSVETLEDAQEKEAAVGGLACGR
jgi:hypothetical protein